jgi:hypothetical protein
LKRYGWPHAATSADISQGLIGLISILIAVTLELPVCRKKLSDVELGMALAKINQVR